MSRRQSRLSVDTHQNDTLLEFETFKKKFLLANKHITKLNSTLSVRIEELNAQISTLYVENLRLRASEIALASQLKKERDKSRKMLADAESATHALMKHFGHMRKSFNISQQASTTPEQSAPPRARRPPPNPNSSPTVPRLARAPTIPGIVEDEEQEDDAIVFVGEPTPSPTPQRRKSKPRASLAREVEEITLVHFDEELSKAGKRKPTRRQSGLLTAKVAVTVSEAVPARPPSPAFGSPLRREAALDEEEEVIAAISATEPMDEDEDEEPIAMTITRRDKKKKTREKDERERDREKEVERDRDRELVAESSRRDREKRRTRDSDDGPGPFETKKPKLKDVTNSPPPRPSLATLEITSDRDRQRSPDTDLPPISNTSAAATTSYAAARNFLTPVTTPAQLPRTTSDQRPSLPTPRSSSPLLSIPASDSDPQAAGRERRTRKSVNYAEPKLNTKMRKPDPPPSSSSKRGSSASELPSRKSLVDAPPVPSTAGDIPSQPQPLAGVKRKKSRVYIPVAEEEESEGAQADAEYGGLHVTDASSGWVSESRRRSVAHHTSGVRRGDGGDELRRHSMAV
ncbi:hypothetical protein BDW22DRAFT_1353770 [Trametopsis cervina]|nr:hypothetical protein BDW22DRAFT_1353770 [Trametopsis cervina]